MPTVLVFQLSLKKLTRADSSFRIEIKDEIWAVTDIIVEYYIIFLLSNGISFFLPMEIFINKNKKNETRVQIPATNLS